MLEYVEVSPLPKECEGCQEDNCYNCDYTLLRWKLTPESEKHLANLIEKQKKARQIKIKQMRKKLKRENPQYQ